MAIVVQHTPSPALTAAAAYRTGKGQRGQYLDQLALQRGQLGLSEQELGLRNLMQLRDIGSREFMQGRDLADREAGRITGVLSSDRQQTRQFGENERGRQFGFAADQSLQGQRINEAQRAQLMDLFNQQLGRDFTGGQNEQQRQLQRELQSQDIQFRQGEGQAQRALQDILSRRDVGASLAGQAAGLTQRETESVREDTLRRDIVDRQIAEAQRAQSQDAIVNLHRMLTSQDFADYTLSRQQQHAIRELMTQGGIQDALQQPRLQQEMAQQQMAIQAQMAQQQADQQFRAQMAQQQMQASFAAQQQEFQQRQVLQTQQFMQNMGLQEARMFGSGVDIMLQGEMQKEQYTNKLLAEGYTFSPANQQLRDDAQRRLTEIQQMYQSGELGPYEAQRAGLQALRQVNSIVPTEPPQRPFSMQEMVQNGFAELPGGGGMFGVQKPDGTVDYQYIPPPKDNSAMLQFKQQESLQNMQFKQAEFQQKMAFDQQKAMMDAQLKTQQMRQRFIEQQMRNYQMNPAVDQMVPFDINGAQMQAAQMFPDLPMQFGAGQQQQSGGAPDLMQFMPQAGAFGSQGGASMGGAQASMAPPTPPAPAMPQGPAQPPAPPTFLRGSTIPIDPTSQAGQPRLDMNNIRPGQVLTVDRGGQQRQFIVVQTENGMAVTPLR